MKKSIRKRAPSPPGGASGGQEDEDKKKQPPPAPKPANKYSSGESSEEEEEDTREMEGNVYLKSGIEVSRRVTHPYVTSNYYGQWLMQGDGFTREDK